MLLAACGTSVNAPVAEQPRAELPPVPADIAACFRESVRETGDDIPDRDLTASEVESLWKIDRVYKVVYRKCGVRFIAWYQGLRRDWK